MGKKDSIIRQLRDELDDNNKKWLAKLAKQKAAFAKQLSGQYVHVSHLKNSAYIIKLVKAFMETNGISKWAFSRKGPDRQDFEYQLTKD